MFCNFCGKTIQDDAVHCAYCGRRVGLLTPRRSLVRPRAGRQIAGVCAGLAEYFDLDVTLIRLVFVLSFIFGGFGFIAYLVGWVVMPSVPEALPYTNTATAEANQ